MIEAQTLFFALLGGILPALVWLWFWLREDSKNPEPRSMLSLAFLGGILSAILVYPVENWIVSLFGYEYLTNLMRTTVITLIIILWATSEEIFKFLGAYFTAIRKKCTDEPIDVIIYMVATALGFAALENAFFIADPFSKGQFVFGLVTLNQRFIGSTLLHTLTAITAGIPMAFAFNKGKRAKLTAIFGGILCAIVLHTLFNLFIINGTEGITIIVFSCVWLLLMVALLFFEKIKKIYPIN